MDIYQLAKTTAELEAQPLEVNQTIYTTCPVCEGKSKFSVTRLRHAVIWNCFRASCPVTGGSAHTIGALVPASKPKPRSKLRPYRGEILPLSEEQEEFLIERFPVHAIPSCIRSTGDGRYVLPIMNPYGHERGYLIRDFPESGLSDWVGPKAMVYMHADGPVMSWLPAGDYEHLVLVEDQISAWCAQLAGISACALIGTHLNNDKVREIAVQQPKEVIIALDADATEEAFKLARKWGLAFNKTRVAVLERDLKDEHDLFDIPEVLGVRAKI